MEFKWMDEKIDKLYKNNWLYRFICFFMRRKLTYKELFIILKRINESHLGNKDSEIMSFNEILKIYKYQNNKMPDELVEYESTR